MQHTKVYVEVVASFREDGLLLPKEIVWEDGRHFEIDRVSDIRSAASMKVGGQGDRYTIWLNGQQRYLFFERNATIRLLLDCCYFYAWEYFIILTSVVSHSI